jgi:hypothetical protein
VERTQNLLYIIQRRSERLALFVCYISSNADRSGSRFLFVIYHSTAYWSGAYPKFIIYHPTPIGATRAFRLLYIIQLPTAWSGAYPKFIIYHPTPIGATRAFRLLYIIQLPTAWSEAPHGHSIRLPVWGTICSLLPLLILNSRHLPKRSLC